MKNFAVLVLILFAVLTARAQSVLTLESCYAGAEETYPLVRQKGLIEQTKDFSIENALKGNLPGITIGAQATYQSEVTRIPFDMPGVEPLSKDQYRIFGEISQTLYHGGLVDQQRVAAENSVAIEEKQLETELYQVRNRVNDLFFGILLLQEQTQASRLIQSDLHSGLRRSEAGIENGTVLPSAADILRAELLRVDQRIIEMSATEEAYRKMLGLFTGRDITKQTVLEKPVFDPPSAAIHRPELEVFDLQSRSLQLNEQMLSARRKPRLELFIQGGYGRPGLNMLDNAFDFYYLGGIRFAWPLSAHYTLKNDKAMFNIRRQSLEVQRETFLFNTRLSLSQHEADIARLRELLSLDDEIILLRARVRQTAEVQLGEGIITSSDFIREVNAEDQAKQNRLLHEVQLLMAQARYNFTTGQ